MKDDPSKAYLGDGVYASFDGCGISLYANDPLNPTDEIYLEPEVMSGLIKFNEEIKGRVWFSKKPNLEFK